MANFEFWQKNDLTRPIQVQAIRGVTFTEDSLANLFGVEVTDNGAAATLTGSVQGWVIRGDGTSLTPITGTRSGNKASFILPAAAYAIPGTLDIVIKLISGSGANTVKTTLAAWHGFVQRSSTGTIVDPGTDLPDISDLLAMLDEMGEATAAANTAASLANTKAGVANDAASAANSAASLANTRATAAQNAAAAANTAAAKLENLDATATSANIPKATVSTVNGHYRIAFELPRGEPGTNGQPGTPASVSSSALDYAVSSSGTTIPTTGWSSSIPTVPQGKYLWQRTTLVWNNSTTTTQYICARHGVDGSGSVSSVNGYTPDGNGNVTLPAALAVDCGTIYALPATAFASGITSDMRVIGWKMGTPGAFAGPLTVTPGTDEMTITGSVVSGASSTLTIILARCESVTAEVEQTPAE